MWLSKYRTLGGCLTILVACRATDGSRRSADLQLSTCVAYATRAPEDSISSTAHGLSVVADLDCDGRRESIDIRNATGDDRTFPLLVVESATLAGTLAMMTDETPEIAVLGDLDGDGVRDAVFTVVDESTIFSRVILFTSGGPRRPKLDRSLDWRQFQYIRDEYTPQACIASAFPTIERVGGRNALRLPYGGYGGASEAPCGDMNIAFLEVTNGVLTLRRD